VLFLAEPRYWVFSVTQKNWETARKHSIWAVSSDRLKSLIMPGDYIVLYVKGTKEFQGAYEFIEDWYVAEEPIWEDEKEAHKILYPHQIKIRPIQLGNVSVQRLASKLGFIEKKEVWYVYLMGTPANWSKPINKIDFELIVEELKKAPFREPEVPIRKRLKPEEDVHTKMQWILIQLGRLGKCNVWVASRDSGKSCKGQKFEDLCLDSLPHLGFTEDVMKLIENIDVLWIRGNIVLAAFEIEHSTSIYSGLLRLSDLVSLIPNVRIQLFIVAPNERKGKVLTEVNRPTFLRWETPLNSICRVWTYDDLLDTYQSLKDQKFLPVWSMDHVSNMGEPCS